MMSKRVRFASQSTVYPPETSISPIAVSFSSPASSYWRSSTLSPYSSKTDGLPGPTPYVFICNPGSRLLEPVKYGGQHGFHPLLEPSVMTYDLRDRVSTATTTHNNHFLSIETKTLCGSAFIPSRLCVTYLPWTIKVYASNDYISPSKIFLPLFTQTFVPI
ncbi:hypothetical protein BYT27DRAFT_7317638 [Phlegmacium glaucopus]|nr:hypothetical protein BYT27DRAFT_7317638 [Phlegmacium glaucopus]